VLASSGEDLLAVSDQGDCAANIEAAETRPNGARPAPGAQKQDVATPTQKTCEAVAALLKGNVLLPADARGWLPVLSGNLPPLQAEALRAISEAGPEFFDAALACYGETGADLAALAERLKARTGRKGKSLYMPLRFALTGRHDGPELAALLAALPQGLVRDRLASASRQRGD